MTRPAVLALDQGGHASRACVVDAHGDVLCEHSVVVDTILGADGSVEHSPEQLVDSVRAAAQGALDALTDTDVEVQGAALATQRSTLVCFDRHTRAALSPALSWQDRRNAPWLAGFCAHSARIGAITGLPLSPHYGVGKMRWCLDHLPAVQQAQRHGRLQMAPLATYLSAQLTGREVSVDPANASRTLLWDAERRDWSAELLTLFGIDADCLPQCGATRENYGCMSIAGRTLPLQAVTGDQSAVVFADGDPDPHTLYLNLGTGAFLQLPLTTRPPSPAPLLGSVLYADATSALYSLEGTVNGAGSALSAWLTEHDADEATLWQQLEESAALQLPLFINGVGGLGSPFWRAVQPSYFVGHAGPLQQFAAVLESIVFLIAINFELMQQRGGAAIERLMVTGGLSRSSWLCRRLAALLQLPVVRGVQEASARGAAALAFGHPLRPARATPTLTFTPQLLASAERAALLARKQEFEQLLQA